MIGLDATVDGVPQLINRLKGFEPEIYKILQRDVRTAADKIGAAARGSVPEMPTSHWAYTGRTGWSRGKVAGGIRPGFRSRVIGGTRTVTGIVTMKNAAGSIFELGGSKDGGQFGALLNAKFGVPAKSNAPRLLGPAWHANVDEAREGIIQAVHAAAEKVSNG